MLKGLAGVWLCATTARAVLALRVPLVMESRNDVEPQLFITEAGHCPCGPGPGSNRRRNRRVVFVAQNRHEPLEVGVIVATGVVSLVSRFLFETQGTYSNSSMKRYLSEFLGTFALV